MGEREGEEGLPKRRSWYEVHGIEGEAEEIRQDRVGRVVG